MKAGGKGNLITTLPKVLGATGLFVSSNTYTSYPGTGFVTLPGKVGKTVLKSARFSKLAHIGHPVSVYHHVSFINTSGKRLLSHLIVSGSHLSPTKQTVRNFVISY